MRTGDSFPLGERTGCSRRTEMKREREGEEGGEKKNNKITDHRRINSISKGSQRWRTREKKGREEGSGIRFSPVCYGGLFLCVNSSMPFNF